MAKKLIQTLNDDLHLKQLSEKLSTIRKAAQERMDFLQRQENQLQEKYSAETEQIWNEINQRLRLTGKLSPDFQPEKFSLHVEYDLGIIYMEERDHPLKHLLGHFFPG